jgi:hypothetical protein
LAKSTLTTTEATRLADLERIVERGMQTFIDVGLALAEIRGQHLYRATHPTFKAYCESRWGFSDSRGRQLIAAARTVTDVTAAGLPAPKTEGEARQLARTLRDLASLEQHPLVRGLLPDIEGDAWTSFVESIHKYGVLNPVMLYEGKVLDGWQRVKACRERGVTLPTETYEGDEPMDIWWSFNFVRAHHPAQTNPAGDFSAIPVR